MNCEDCGAELSKGTYYCGGCGRPVGFNVLEVATAEAEPGLDEIPEPAPSREAVSTESAPLEPAYRTRIQGKGLCGFCMGAFPETVLSIVDGKPYCPDCSPLVGSRRDPEVQEAGARPSPEEHPDVVAGPLFREERSGGGAKGVLAAFVLALLAGVGVTVFLMLDGDRIDEMMAGLDTGRKDAYLLAQTYVSGETFQYGIRGKVKVTGELSGGMLGRSGDLAGTVELARDVTVNVLRVDSRNNAHLSFTPGAVEMDGDLVVDGETVHLGNELRGPLEMLEGEPTVVQLDPFGKPVGPVSGTGMQELLSGVVGLPNRYLKIGDTWTERIPLGNAGGMDLSSMGFVVEYRVEGFKRLQGRDCMAISVAGDFELPEGIGNPLVSDIKCEMGLKGLVFIDVSGGKLVRFALDAGLDVGAAGAMGGLEFDLEFELDMDLK